MERVRLDDQTKKHSRRLIFSRASKLELNQNLILQFSSLLKKGLPIDSCCDYLGISTTTYNDWLRKGDQWLNDLGGDEFEVYGIFTIEVKRAIAEYKLKLVDTLSSNKPGWFSALKILERRDRKNFCAYDPQSTPDDTYSPDEKFL